MSRDRDASDWDADPIVPDPAVSSTPIQADNSDRVGPWKPKTQAAKKLNQYWPTMNDSERKLNRSSPSQGGQNNKTPKTSDTGQYNT